MIINGKHLLKLDPIKNMETHKIRHNGYSHGLTEAGYDIRIAETVQFRTFDGFRMDHFVLDEDDNIIVAGLGRFALASSMEEFKMPNSVIGEVKDKSSWARQGLSVLNTVIEPGWKGFLTLELNFMGATHLTIPRGTGIAQIIFYELMESAQYEGKYQNQRSGPQKAIVS